MITDASVRYRRSPHLVLEWRGSDAVLIQADTLAEFRVEARLVDLLARLGDWTAPGDLATEIGAEELAQLAAARLLEREGDLSVAAAWEPLELAVHRRTGRLGAPRSSPPSSPGPGRPSPMTPQVSLVPGVLDGTLADVLRIRRTRREYGAGLRLAELATLLVHAAGRLPGDPGPVTHRPYASAGARQELTLHVVANDVADLDCGSWTFAHDPPHLILIARDDVRRHRLNAWADGATGGLLSGPPAAIVLITARIAAMTDKYGHLALSLVYKDVGGLLQNLYLVSTALDLAPCAIGGTPGTEVAELLAADPLTDPIVGCFLVGARP